MFSKYSGGWIEVISGPMFSGKSLETIRRARMSEYAKQKVLVVKPLVDSTTSKTIESRWGSSMEAISLKDSNDIYDLVIDKKPDTLVIDEAQFFDNNLGLTLSKLAKETTTRIIVSGLDKDFIGDPFETMANVMARAEFVTKLHAICNVCGEPGTMSQRLINGVPASSDGELIQLKNKIDTITYEARCRKHHEVTNNG